MEEMEGQVQMVVSEGVEVLVLEEAEAALKRVKPPLAGRI